QDHHLEGRVPGRLRNERPRRPLGCDRCGRRRHQLDRQLPCTVREPVAGPQLRRAARPHAPHGTCSAEAEMKSMFTIAWTDLRLSARDRASLLFLVLVPFVVVTVLAQALAGSDTGSLLLPVVNEDEGPVAEVLVKALSEYANVVVVDRATAEHLVARKKV